MSRGLSAGVKTELNATGVRLGLFTEINFLSGPVYLWSGIQDTVTSGDSPLPDATWLGTGALLSIAPSTESSSLRASGASITLTGIDPVYISLALSEARQGKDVNAWLVFLNSSDAIIADPIQFFTGRFDVIKISEGRETATLTVNAESRLIDMARRSNRTYTDQAHRQLHPADAGFEYVEAIQEWNGQWGGGAIGDVDTDDFGNPPPPPPPQPSETFWDEDTGTTTVTEDPLGP